jgi:hypothetical protein
MTMRTRANSSEVGGSLTWATPAWWRPGGGVGEGEGEIGTVREDERYAVTYSAAVSPRRARRLPDDVPRRGRGAVGRGRAGEEDGGFPVGPEHTETWPDGDWVVRLVPGASSGKSYRCPGCDQEIAAGTPHVVAWPALTPGLEERRHWHRACWQRRMQRGPRLRKPR